ncbi:MAG: hypothetical protein ABFD14_12505 [Anaerolineaceae bacterium]
MANLLNEDIHKQLSEIFHELEKPVVLLFFSDKKELCDNCEQTIQLLKEVASTTDKIIIKQSSLEEDAKTAEKYLIDKTPAIAVCVQDGDSLIDHGIRFYGVPSGMEFETFIQTILMVSKGEQGLEKETIAFLKDLKEPVHLQVFVTPT